MRLAASIMLVVFVLNYACNSADYDSSNKLNFAQGAYSVTYYTPGTMPVECKTPPGFNYSDGIAVIEGDPLIDGATCSGWSNGLPDCTRALREKNLCGTIIKVSYNGNTRRGWLTGICPWDHPNNSAKGHWNPCGRGKQNLDLMDSLYFSLGLESRHSWGPDSSQSPWQQNPQAAFIWAEKDSKVDGVGTIH